MSRGLGAIQRRVLERLSESECWMPTYAVALRVFETLNPSAMKSTYRAMRGLHERGLIQLRYRVLNASDFLPSEYRSHRIAQLPGFPVDGDVFTPTDLDRHRLAKMRWRLGIGWRDAGFPAL